MKKITLLLVVFLLSVCACAGEEPYVYADQWDIELFPVSTDEHTFIIEECPSSVSDYDANLDAYKDKIRTNLSHFSRLDWNNLDHVEQIRQVDLTQADIDALPPENRELFVVQAFYDRASGVVYLLPSFFSELDRSAQEIAIYHELIHSLIPAKDSYLVEGLVDMLAILASDTSRSLGDLAYPAPFFCLMALCEIYDGDTVIQAICSDRFAEMLEASTKPGMAEKLEYALGIFHAYCWDDPHIAQYAAYVEIDILTHAARHERANIQGSLSNIKFICEQMGIQVDLDQFNS